MAMNDPSATPEGTETPSGTPPAAVTVPEVQVQPTEQKEPDWRKAFESEQRATSRHARRVDELAMGNAALAEALMIVRKQQEATLKATLPPEQAAAIIAETAASEAASRQKSNIEQAGKVLTTQQAILTHTLEQFGLDPKQIDWANDARSIDEYQERVTASINVNVAKAREGLLASVGKAVETNTKVEKERLADEHRKALKAAGVEKIDTAAGSPSTFGSRLAALAASPDGANSKEFAELTEAALDGRLRGIKI